MKNKTFRSVICLLLTLVMMGGLLGYALPAEAEAATVVARPGTSEHHTGLAADFNMADDKFETTEMYRWMQEHAADYGFIMRYSGEKQSVTGVIHESWHYRFVGREAATEIMKRGITLEEFLSMDFQETK